MSLQAWLEKSSSVPILSGHDQTVLSNSQIINLAKCCRVKPRNSFGLV